MTTPAKPPAFIIDVEPEEEKPKGRAQCCGNCNAGDFPVAASKDGLCRAGLPTHQIFLVPYQDPIRMQQGIRADGRSGWPPVKRDNWCRNGWQPRETH